MKNKVLLRIIVFALGFFALSGCDRNETYIVIFDANGGTGTMRSQEFVEGEAQALRQNAFTRSGFSFSGWNTTQNGSGTAYSNGQTITINSDMTLYAQWTNSSSQGGNGSGSGSGSGTGDDPGNGSGTQSTVSGSLNGHDYVDLGLPSGTLWATCNVGATTPEGYGNYYAWGETTTKENYSWSTYRWCNGSKTTLTKYCSYSWFGYNGYTDTLTTLEPSDDAAAVNWGAGWRMPTYDEFRELSNTITWTTQNGIYGYLATGPNGNSIFLPAAGGRDDNYMANGGGSGYWSNTVQGLEAFYLQTNYTDSGVSSEERFRGYTVRPVCVNR